MSWQQLAFEIPAADLPQADALLRLLGAQSIELTGRDGGEEVLEPPPGSTPVWSITTVRALFPASVELDPVANIMERHFGPGLNVEVTPIADDTWLEATQSRPANLEIGSRLLVTGAANDTASDERIVVRLNRGLGFGTGEHPTTRLCLEWLEAKLPSGANVIDYGCGSGILAVAALRLGAAFAWAVDIEPQAIDATVANAALNGVGTRLWTGMPDALSAARADVVLANILAGPLIDLAPRLAGLVEKTGTIVLAGLLADQAASVSARYATHFAKLARRDRDGWACIVASAPIG